MQGSTVSITDVCDFQGGSQPPKNEWKNKPQAGYIRMLQIRDFTQRKEEHIAYVQNSNKIKTCNKDDILIGRYGASVGKILTGLSGAYNVAIMKTIPDFEKLDKRFLYFLLKSPHFQFFIQNVGVRAAQAGFSKKDLKKYKFFLPKSKDDQIKIANLLTQIEALIAKRKESIKLLDELLKSTFLDMFGDPIANPQSRDEVRLDEIVVLQRGFDLPKSQRSTNGNIPLYGSNGIVDFHDESKFEEGIITGRSGTIGKVYYSYEPFWPLNTTLFSKDTKGNNIIYLAYLLDLFKLERFHQGAGVPTLNRNNVHKEKIYKVDRSEQDKFATIVQQVNATKEHYQNSLDELNELFGSLSQRAFRGELDLSTMPNIETQEIKTIPGVARSSSGDDEHIEIIDDKNKETTILDKVIDKLSSEYNKAKELNKILEQENKNNIPKSYVDNSNNPVYNEEFLWMLLQQSDEDITYGSIEKKLKLYSFKKQLDYNQVKSDIFSLIKKGRLEQKYVGNLKDKETYMVLFK